MSISSNGNLDLTPLLKANCALISRRVEPDLIAQHFSRSLDVVSDEWFEDVVATIDIDGLEFTNQTISVVLKATGFSSYSLIRDSFTDNVYEEFIIIRK